MNPQPQAPYFWRDEQLPFIEARSVGDGRKLCYAKHSHEVFSIGAITAGQSTYLHEKSRQHVGAGTVVLMNPGDVHACNPIADQHWSYLMLYVDTQWLTGLQHELGLDGNHDFQPIAQTHSTSPGLFRGLNNLYAMLIDDQAEVLHKQCTAIAFFSQMQQTLGSLSIRPELATQRVERAAQYINDNFKQPITLEDMCNAASLSGSYLIRAFEQRYHMTPHAYLINRRIQHARTQLKNGSLIADVAHELGFADQAHFQRAFKKHLAATPGQYRLQ
ncbi:AraC family transcriptional regulator [Pseudomonas syringae group sp. J309-1]|uniref:AraC family transcriptional regulator n=1 Tax=Pseudomonas syringae group sp. J309-1 TaxID=3079588 RepID=UPI0029157B31|nr:AraC family transcriptional regulator [Pseudomonas syringae group sp. J309-1]MDU8359475.1 AraC family transcriptional regulator [Pseudomonas syringae group sp. J309-1]